MKLLLPPIALLASCATPTPRYVTPPIPTPPLHIRRAADTPGTQFTPYDTALTILWEIKDPIPSNQVSIVWSSYDLKTWTMMDNTPSARTNGYSFDAPYRCQFFRVSSNYGPITNLWMDP